MTFIPLLSSERYEKNQAEAAEDKRREAEVVAERRAREAEIRASRQPQQPNWSQIDQRIAQAIDAQMDELVDELGIVLVDRLKNNVGHLPMLAQWEQEKVYYGGTLVSHDGALWQARTDTAQCPSPEATQWALIARAARDGVDGADGSEPNPRGDYDAADTYARLDIVCFEGASYIARRGAPGLPGVDPGPKASGARPACPARAVQRATRARAARTAQRSLVGRSIARAFAPARSCRTGRWGQC
jgi:hypothetical protein